jgi:hypothetical protein
MKKYDGDLVAFLADRRGAFICVPCIFALMWQEDKTPVPELRNGATIYDTVGTCVICGELTDVLRADFPAGRAASAAVA